MNGELKVQFSVQCQNHLKKLIFTFFLEGLARLVILLFYRAVRIFCDLQGAMLCSWTIEGDLHRASHIQFEVVMFRTATKKCHQVKLWDCQTRVEEWAL